MERPRSFVLAFLLQKTAEFFLLATLYSATDYVVARSDGGRGGYFDRVHTFREAIAEGFSASSIFFLFTFYPLLTLGLVALARHVIGPRRAKHIAAASTLICVTYAWIWIADPDFLHYILPLGFVTTLMAAFIYWSSLKLYPR